MIAAVASIPYMQDMYKRNPGQNKQSSSQENKNKEDKEDEECDMQELFMMILRQLQE